MKKISIILISLILLFSCNNSTKNTKQTIAKDADASQPINQQEVTRIALVEVRQFIDKTQQKGVDVSFVVNDYNAAMLAYRQGKYKQAQVQAVKVRGQLEELYQTE